MIYLWNRNEYQAENQVLNEGSDTDDTYGTYSVNNSSEEDDVAMTTSSYQTRNIMNDSGSLKVGRFIIAKSG